MLINTRLETLGSYPFTKLSRLLADVQPRANAAPILMSVGEPQHQPPALLAETVAAHADLWNRYPTILGTPELRDAAAAWLARRYSLPAGLITPEKHVLPVVGTKEGLFLAGLFAVPEAKNGRRPVVAMPNPFYLVYAGSAAMSGAEIVYLDATARTSFLPDLDALDEETLARTAVFFLCTPSNPQGAIASLDYLKRVIGLARRYEFTLVIDECYAEIYDRTAAPPVGGLQACVALGGSLDNVLVFHSLSKRSSAAGLRSGFVAGDPKLIAGMVELRNYGSATVPLPLQAAAAALWRDEAHVESNRALYWRKIDVAESILGTRFRFYRPPGGFFLWLDVGDGEHAATVLWREAAVRTVPGAYFARPDARGENPGKRFLRVALVHDEATVAEALTRMARVL
jgi:aspartate/methionine/tyrosine aminotransferase